MSNPSDCLFCRIVAGEIPATIAGESALVLAFQDLAPVAPLHLLLVPKAHVADASALDESHGALLGELFALAARLAAEGGVAPGGYRLLVNVGEDAGNSVGHLHLHLIGGRAMAWPPRLVLMPERGGGLFDRLAD